MDKKNLILKNLDEDVRFHEALSACMNCGICTAICPAAEFYKYDPRAICNIVQMGNVDEIEDLLKSDTIWYCGQCMSCKTRCPRGNTPGMLITVLRKVSQELGYFTESEKGRQQFAIEQIVGKNIVNFGYCVHPDIVEPFMHPEQGPVWKWFRKNIESVAPRFGAVYHQEKAGALRKVDDNSIDEIRRIFEVSGGNELFDTIEKFSEQKASEYHQNADHDYLMKVYTDNSGEHSK
jgi:heterodisulfide reductase subunit C1